MAPRIRSGLATGTAPDLGRPLQARGEAAGKGADEAVGGDNEQTVVGEESIK
ncbi:hypothetical protein HCJ76_06285 [Streptomyces sp. MC1]|uniref:hypothetical protein n=1 Tax=unclassified Streptomyces TaxID=2593676 RepID=UPI000B0031D8|nr:MULTISPECIES: hypothetical protein [unclassified Streptomyces]MBG7697696.1 hypothetical protein [Streptomyces sp. MC1]